MHHSALSPPLASLPLVRPEHDDTRVIFAWRQARAANEIAISVAHREIRELAFGMHRDLTTGEVAEARNCLGTWRYGAAEQRRAVTDSQLIQAFYIVLWCLERMANGEQILRQQQRVLTRLSAKRGDADGTRDLHRQSFPLLGGRGAGLLGPGGAAGGRRQRCSGPVIAG